MARQDIPLTEKLQTSNPKINGNFTELYDHLQSRDGHPPATTTEPGFLTGNDQLKLEQLPQRYHTAPGFTDYDMTLTANTWTRLNNGTANLPQISVPALPAPPTGTAWRLRVGRFGYVTTPGAATVFFSASINAASLGPLHGGGYIAGLAADVKPIDTVLTPPTGAAFTVDFAIYASVAGTYKIMGNGGVSPSASLYLVAV